MDNFFNHVFSNSNFLMKVRHMMAHVELKKCDTSAKMVNDLMWHTICFENLHTCPRYIPCHSAFGVVMHPVPQLNPWRSSDIIDNLYTKDAVVIFSIELKWWFPSKSYQNPNSSGFEICPKFKVRKPKNSKILAEIQDGGTVGSALLDYYRLLVVAVNVFHQNLHFKWPQNRCYSSPIVKGWGIPTCFSTMWTSPDAPPLENFSIKLLVYCWDPGNKWYFVSINLGNNFKYITSIYCCYLVSELYIKFILWPRK